MENRKFSLEVIERNRITKFSETIFGVLCLAGALWFAVSLPDQSSGTYSGWLAIVFLAFFGAWEILSGAGIVSRYIIIGSDIIIIRDRFWKPAVTITPEVLEEVRFKALTIDFCLEGRKSIAVRLGTYYSERSAEIMEAVETFCTVNSVKIAGEKSHQEKE